MSWYIVRYGTVAEQGGFNLGTETVSFETLNAAFAYLEEMISNDMEVIKEVISKKEKET